MLFKLLKENWPLITVILAGLLLWLRLDAVKAERDTAIAQRDNLQVQLDGVSAQLATQNAGIRALADAAKANREVYLAGLEAANRRAIRLEIDAEEILSLPSPSTPPEQCEAARALLLTD